MPADLNGVDLNPVQDTPVATRKEDTYIHFSVEVEIQRHVEKLPKGSLPTPDRVTACHGTGAIGCCPSYLYTLNICVTFKPPPRSSYLLRIQALQTQKEVHQHKMFCLHGDGRDQTRADRDRAVSLPPPPLHPTVASGNPSCRSPLACEVKSCPCVYSQVQEAHRLQEEETAASHKETTLSPPPSDVTQRQLSRTIEPPSLTSASSKMWCSPSSHLAILKTKPFFFSPPNEFLKKVN